MTALLANPVKGENAPCSGQTIAEGIAVKAPGEIAKRVIAANVADILLAGEPEIEAAIVKLLEIEKTLAEGAGAAALAAVLGNTKIFAHRKVGVVISGGNTTQPIFARKASLVPLRERCKGAMVGKFAESV